MQHNIECESDPHSIPLKAKGAGDQQSGDILPQIVHMGAGDRDGEEERDRGGGVAVKTRAPDGKTQSDLEIKTSVEFKGNWRVLLHRDEWITFDYCEFYLIQIVPTLTRKKVCACVGVCVRVCVSVCVRIFVCMSVRVRMRVCLYETCTVSV